MKYYSIRVIEADDKDQAEDRVMDNVFNEDDDLCDKIMTGAELLEALSHRQEHSYLVKYEVQDGDSEYTNYTILEGSEMNIGGKIKEYFTNFWEGGYKDSDNDDLYHSGDGCQSLEIQTYTQIPQEDIPVLRKYFNF